MRLWPAFVVALVVGLAAHALARDRADPPDVAARTPRIADKGMPTPIARWRVHAKVVEGIYAKDQRFDIAKYCRLAGLEPAETLIIYMSLTNATLQQAKSVLRGQSASVKGAYQLSAVEDILANEAAANEIELTGSGPNLRLRAIWPPPGYRHIDRDSK